MNNIITLSNKQLYEYNLKLFGIRKGNVEDIINAKHIVNDIGIKCYENSKNNSWMASGIWKIKKWKDDNRN